MEAASRTRLTAGCDAYTSLCAYDAAEKLGLDLWFQPRPSLEGLYLPGDPPVVVVSAMRPSGRQRMNCAHEIGHHIFAHGAKVDELIDETRAHSISPEEFLANCFAEFFLMPKLAVLAAAKRRGLALAKADPLDIYRLSNYFGVGYSSLIHHLQRNLNLLTSGRAIELKKTQPRKIRELVLGNSGGGELFLADQHWMGRPIDLHVGDTLVTPVGCDPAELLTAPKTTLHGEIRQALVPGSTVIANTRLGWSTTLRVAPRIDGGGFVGRNMYRHEEPVDD